MIKGQQTFEKDGKEKGKNKFGRGKNIKNFIICAFGDNLSVKEKEKVYQRAFKK